MASATTTVGTIATMWRYPVKSMLGEELNATQVLERGLLGDRAYALIDAETGKTISAKSPRRWGKMFDCRAAMQSPSQIKMTLPDGAIVFSNAANVEQTLSSAFGRPVKLETTAPIAPSIEMYTPEIDELPNHDQMSDAAIRPGTFFDAATIHLLTTATMNQLQSIVPTSRFETRRFRPNFVIQPASSAAGFVENEWVGKILAMGDEVKLTIDTPCPRCVMTTLAQGELPHDLEILRAAVKHNGGNIGVYASVMQSGTVRRGDIVRLVGA